MEEQFCGRAPHPGQCQGSWLLDVLSFAWAAVKGRGHGGSASLAVFLAAKKTPRFPPCQEYEWKKGVSVLPVATCGIFPATTTTAAFFLEREKGATFFLRRPAASFHSTDTAATRGVFFTALCFLEHEKGATVLPAAAATRGVFFATQLLLPLCVSLRRAGERRQPSFPWLPQLVASFHDVPLRHIV
ncbi:hypothetical protein NDU88_003208 [Pleurodeles waltl]|uniref:Transmembrane protein n=1 Tax=Pleurodeles waltl TaxID=8319 RepID=A0AAV7PD55_PLEWA|nr:hypothetical protein NDU88_003208 [Pleurodeles waltl]